MAGATEFEELTFTITYRKLDVPNVTLSALLLQLKTGFKRTIKWIKYQSQPKLKTRN